jgi:hypothetical protein
VVSNLRFIDLCDRGTLGRVGLCLTTPKLFFGLSMTKNWCTSTLNYIESMFFEKHLAMVWS